MSKGKNRNEMLREYLKELGRKGGQERAKRHSKKQLSDWGALGGRPRGTAKPKKGGKQ